MDNSKQNIIMKTIVKFFLLGGVVWLAAENFSGISVVSYQYALIAAVVLALVNSFIRPVLKLLSAPISFLTLGLFSFVINALMVMLMDYLVDGFSVTSFWWALIFSVLISFAGTVIESLLGTKKKK